MTMQKIRLVSLIWFVLAIAGCISNDKSILVKEGDDQLDCPALAQEYDDADSLGINKSARRRHIRSLQKQKRVPSLLKSLSVLALLKYSTDTFLKN